MTTVGMVTQLQITPKQLVRVLGSLSPEVSALVVGLHGIGKSQISAGLGALLRERYPEHRWPVFDRRLAQMTEGDLLGIPDRATMGEDAVSKFLPVDWWKTACNEPCVIILEEMNRAEIQMMQGGFQIVGARELNGLKLHPMTRVIACVNPPTHYQVQEMDKALLDRFAIFHLEHSVEDWLAWARGKLDDAVVDFIKDSPQWLHHDVTQTVDLQAAPTPRSWHLLDKQLRYAGISPSECMGRAAPDLLPIFANALLGGGAATAFLKWLRDRQRFLALEDVLDNWSESVERLARSLRHEEILSCIDRIGAHSKENTWSTRQVANLADFAEKCLSGEDKILLFTGVASSGNQRNILSLHGTSLTSAIVNQVQSTRKIGS